MEDEINAFEMWIFRRMSRISHLDRKTDVEMLEMAKVKHTLLRSIQDRNLQYITIYWTLDMRKRKTKTTHGRKDRRVKMQREAKKDLDK